MEAKHFDVLVFIGGVFCLGTIVANCHGNTEDKLKEQLNVADTKIEMADEKIFKLKSDVKELNDELFDLKQDMARMKVDIRVLEAK